LDYGYGCMAGYLTFLQLAAPPPPPHPNRLHSKRRGGGVRPLATPNDPSFECNGDWSDDRVAVALPRRVVVSASVDHRGGRFDSKLRVRPLRLGRRIGTRRHRWFPSNYPASSAPAHDPGSLLGGVTAYRGNVFDGSPRRSTRNAACGRTDTVPVAFPLHSI